MSYNDPKPEQLGSTWLAETSKKHPDKVVEAIKAGALQDLLQGRDVDGCTHCGGTGKRTKKETA